MLNPIITLMLVNIVELVLQSNLIPCSPQINLFDRSDFICDVPLFYDIII